MKRILIACGSGIVTSTTVITKVKELLDGNGYKNNYSIRQCKVTEAAGLSEGADFLIATTNKPDNLKCDFVSGIPFLTGMGVDKSKEEILKLMEK